MKKVLGIMGGIGPMSSVYFYKLITEKTLANSDNEHIDIILSSKSSTPDRTAYILGESDLNPLPVMIEEAKKLRKYGADLIAIACNTAHYFYEKIQNEVDIPVLNIGEICVKNLYRQGVKSLGVMATTGTIEGKIYQNNCSKIGMDCIIPNDDEQEKIMEIIYKYIKAGKEPPLEEFFRIANSLKEKGAEVIALACTELSLIKESGKLDNTFVDPLEILAETSIIKCGYGLKYNNN